MPSHEPKAKGSATPGSWMPVFVAMALEGVHVPRKTAFKAPRGREALGFDPQEG